MKSSRRISINLVVRTARNSQLFFRQRMDRQIFRFPALPCFPIRIVIIISSLFGAIAINWRARDIERATTFRWPLVAVSEFRPRESSNGNALIDKSAGIYGRRRRSVVYSQRREVYGRRNSPFYSVRVCYTVNDLSYDSGPRYAIVSRARSCLF